jgi:hypothetical protein
VAIGKPSDTVLLPEGPVFDQLMCPHGRNALIEKIFQEFKKVQIYKKDRRRKIIKEKDSQRLFYA